MQHPTLQIRDRLLADGLDRDYNVVDMSVVIEVLSQLENIPVSREVLEVSRLGKHINELRKKTSDKTLANRAKSLVKKWRDLLIVSTAAQASGDHQSSTLVNGNGQNSRLTSPADTVTINSKCSPGLRPLSSLPSSASTSPGLPVSRPTTPLLPPGSQPVSPYLRSAGLTVLSTSGNNNKRPLQPRCDGLTKNGIITSPDMGLPNAKRPRLNGGTPIDHDESSQNSDIVPKTPVTTYDATSNKRKSRAARIREEDEDVLKHRMNSVRKSSGKVRTTKELVQELALRSASPGNLLTSENFQSVNASGAPTPRGPSPNGISKNNLSAIKSELMNRFLESQGEPPSTATSADELDANSPKDQPVAETKETVEDILARLPAIDSASILAQLELEGEEEDDELEVEGLIPVMRVPKQEVGPEQLAELHDGQKESVNGNFSHDGNFREWFEVVTKKTKDEEDLCILPYCVID